MPATIRTTCPSCGTVEIAVAAALLRLSVNGADRRNVVEFTCPSCGSPATQRVNERGTRLLSAAGIEVVAPQPDAARAADTRLENGNG